MKLNRTEAAILLAIRALDGEADREGVIREACESEGLRTETVSKVFDQLEDRMVIEQEGRWYVIASVDAENALDGEED